MKKHFGFTLAEVLITLGIIGVVAAMTLPTLVANYQKTVMVTQLKKEVNTLSNNFKKIMADEQVYKLSDTSIFDSTGAINADAYKNYFQANYADENSKFGDYVSSTFNRDINGRQIKGMYFNDGSCFAFVDYEGAVINGGGNMLIKDSILIDVNCDKKPNKVGRDILLVDYDDNGVYIDLTKSLSPGFDSQTADEFCKGLIATADTNEEEYKDDGATLISWAGRACLQSIVNHGWKMTY